MPIVTIMILWTRLDVHSLFLSDIMTHEFACRSPGSQDYFLYHTTSWLRKNTCICSLMHLTTNHMTCCRHNSPRSKRDCKPSHRQMKGQKKTCNWIRSAVFCTTVAHEILMPDTHRTILTKLWSWWRELLLGNKHLAKLAFDWMLNCKAILLTHSPALSFSCT